jgi:orotidine-5'-phosphate decarboxylase
MPSPTIIDNPVCLVLDDPDPAGCRRLAELTESSVGLFKVGLTSFAAGGAGLVRELGALRPVFLDLKLHDIPAQVEGATRVVSALGISYLTVHAAGGRAMISAATRAAAPDVQVLAVTILTSLDSDELTRLGMGGPIEQRVLRLAESALEAGAHGLVCSPLEVKSLRERFGTRSRGGPLLVVPGIRDPHSARHDQRRTLPAREAVEAGADVIVVGRLISAAPDPAAAARRVLAEVKVT